MNDGPELQADAQHETVAACSVNPTEAGCSDCMRVMLSGFSEVRRRAAAPHAVCVRVRGATRMYCSLHADLAHGCGTEGHIEGLPAVLPLSLAGRRDHAEVFGGILQGSSPPLRTRFRLAK